MDGQKESLLEVGNVVQLKSGGPSSTVSRVVGDLVEVVWFDERDERYKTYEFPDYVLVKIEA